MPKQFEANTLEEAYEKASLAFNCSVVDLKIDIIQTPSNGFLGFFKKKAIIKAKLLKKSIKQKHKTKKANIDIQPISSRDIDKNINSVDNNITSINHSQVEKEQIFNDFYQNEQNLIENKIIIKKDLNQIKDEIQEKLNSLFEKSCYNIEPIKVELLDNNTVYIEFNGADSALLIGKEGYRYKALSYMLFNWINAHYGLYIKLEIAEFIQSQEEMIVNYLKPIIEHVNENGRGKTKPLDGILVQIALEQLRAQFPNKYVAIKTSKDNRKFIIINNFNNSKNV